MELVPERAAAAGTVVVDDDIAVVVDHIANLAVVDAVIVDAVVVAAEESHIENLAVAEVDGILESDVAAVVVAMVGHKHSLVDEAFAVERLELHKTTMADGNL